MAMPKQAWKQPIKCIETGKRYESMAEAGRDTGINKESIRHAIKAGRPCKGLHFENGGEPNGHRHFSKILCVETGKIYKDCQEAGRETFVCPNGINQTLNNPKRHRTAGGYHWQRVEE